MADSEAAPEAAPKAPFVPLSSSWLHFAWDMVDLSAAAVWTWVTSLHVIPENYTEFLVINGFIIGAGAAMAAWGCWSSYAVLAHPERVRRLERWDEENDMMIGKHHCCRTVDPLKTHDKDVEDVAHRRHRTRPRGLPPYAVTQKILGAMLKKVNRHLYREFLYDAIQFLLMAWLMENTPLKEGDYTGKVILDFVNLLTTAVDVLLFKGPEAVPSLWADPKAFFLEVVGGAK